jgi:hypothetical protein
MLLNPAGYQLALVTIIKGWAELDFTGNLLDRTAVNFQNKKAGM